ncbi:MAG: hypothetical protein KDD40_11140, partial [Bdellovibrionales bacterium]|nr:hypothetical protein [Bdellovibrionales bacterium]
MKLLLLLFIFLPLTISFADDDLLSILENSPVESLMEEHSELEQVLKNEIGTVTAEQNIFFTFLRKNEFEKALFQWPAAFEDSKFAETPSGQALYAYLILKNSMPIIALEKLFQIKDVNKIPRLLKQIWHLEVPSEHRVWRSAHLQWRPEWREVFDLNSEVLVQSRQKFDLAQKTEIFDLLKKSKLKSNVRYWVEWQMALSLAMNNEVGKSAKVLAHLLNENQQVISKELITITAAR